MNRFLDLCWVLMLTAMLGMLAAVLILGTSDLRGVPETAAVHGSIILMANLSTGVFVGAFIPIWGFAWWYFYQTQPNRTLTMNAVMFGAILGFSWLAGMILYSRHRKAFAMGRSFSSFTR